MLSREQTFERRLAQFESASLKIKQEVTKKVCSKLFLLSAILFSVVSLPAHSQTLPPFAQCPAVGADSSCAVLITIDSQGSLRVDTDLSQGPFDVIEDTLVGVQNNSSKPIASIPLKSPLPIFGFDGDGLCLYVTCTWPHPTNYEGSSLSNPGLVVGFSVNSPNSGTVTFSPALPPRGSAYFSLEERIQTLCPPIAGVPLIKQTGSATPSDAGGNWGPDTYDHDYYTNVYPNATTWPILPAAGSLELVIIPVGIGGQQDGAAGTAYAINLTVATNNLNGVRAAINALGVAGLTAIVLLNPKQSNRPYLSLGYSSAANSLQLRQTAGNPASNILQHISRWGCYLTSTVMVINYQAAKLGLPFRTSPRALNNWLNENEG